MLMMAMGLVSGAYLSYIRYFQNQTANRPLLFLTILLIFLGFQMITLGLIAEMLSRVYHEGLNKNVYTISDTIGFNDEDIDDST